MLDQLGYLLYQYVMPALAVVVTFALAVLLHEFGHFVFARLMGVSVEVFSVGFGRRLWGFKGKSGTDYRVSAVPLGGYVKMRGMLSEEAERYLEGEEPAEPVPEGQKSAAEAQKVVVKPAEKPPEVTLMADAIDSATGLRRRPWPARVLVFAAGCLFNLLVAVVALSMIAWMGTQIDAPFPALVGRVAPESSLYAAGLRVGDRIVSVAGRPVSIWAQNLDSQPPGFLDVLENEAKKQATKIRAMKKAKNDAAREKIENTLPHIAAVIAREEDGQVTSRSLSLPPVTKIAAAVQDHQLEPQIAPAYISNVIPFFPAHKAGIKPGDIVTAANSKPIQAFAQLQEILQHSANKPITLTVERGGKTMDIQITPKEKALTPGVGEIGIIPGNANRLLFKADFLHAWPVGFRQAIVTTKAVAVATYQIFARFRLRELKENVAGPLGIFSVTFLRAREGLDAFLQFMALFNIALAIFNLLPIPVLDGGHILITTVESVTRRPVPPKVLAGIFYVFFALLLSFVAMVTLFDLLRIANLFS
jgi:regulator of sigma E protease